MVEPQDRVIRSKKDNSKTVSSVNPPFPISDEESRKLQSATETVSQTNASNESSETDEEALVARIQEELENFDHEINGSSTQDNQSAFLGSNPGIDLSKMEVRGPAAITGVVVDPKFVGAISQLQFGLSDDDDLLLRFALRVVNNSRSFAIEAKDVQGEFYLNTINNERYLSTSVFSEMINKLRRSR